MVTSNTNPSKGTRLDPWFGAYAQRAHKMRASEVRALFAVASRPEVVSLAGGMPNLADLPLDDIAESTAKVIATEGMTALQYGSGQGRPELREKIVEVMRLEGIEAHPDDIVVTTGSQQALDLVTRIFIDPGDVIVAEAPSYVGALSVFRSYEAEIEHVRIDENGLVPAELDEALTRLKAEGRRVKFLYTIPNFHNPAGVTIPMDRRYEIVEICKRHNVVIVEDNPYGLLGFDREPVPAMRSFEEDGVIYLGSFSKTFAPGYRVGWAVAPHAVREKLVLAQESAILCPSHASQMAIESYLSNHDWKRQIREFQSMYKSRRDAMISALSEYLPDAQWNVPDGGFYVWVKLPAGLDSKTMLPRAVTGRVAYTPGTAFFYDGTGADHIRLSFCYPNEATIREGVRRLAAVISAESESVEIFGTTPQIDDVTDVDVPGPDIA